MGMVEVARDALKDIPISEVLRERLSLAVDRLEETEGKIGVLQAEKGGLQAQLERERIDHEQTKKEMQRLEDLLHEEIRFIQGVEFRKGTRTGGVWMPFCPKCHLPVVFSTEGGAYPIFCADADCNWHSGAPSFQVQTDSMALVR